MRDCWFEKRLASILIGPMSRYLESASASAAARDEFLWCAEQQKNQKALSAESKQSQRGVRAPPSILFTRG